MEERRGGCVLHCTEDTCALRQGLSWAGAVDGEPPALRKWPQGFCNRGLSCFPARPRCPHEATSCGFPSGLASLVPRGHVVSSCGLIFLLDLVSTLGSVHLVHGY